MTEIGSARRWTSSTFPKDKRGLKHAELQDKSSPLGKNDDDAFRLQWDWVASIKTMNG